MEKRIEFGRFGQRKRPNYKKSLLLIIVLIVIVLVYYYADEWISKLF
jgi:hypothetical protein